jgi:RNA polymerase sigma factor (sigma-70 family)
MGLDAAAPLPAVAQPVAVLPAVALLPRPHPLLATPRSVLRMRSDAALAERFRAGDQEAFSVLYERHRASVLAVCIGVLGSRHDAEDAAQDAFAALALALRANPPRDLRPWLARVARNAAIDVIRRRRVVTTADETVEDRAPATTEVRAELQSVLAGLRELPESQRTALLMRELGGHSYREIGELLDLDEAAVRGLISRGRIGLRAHREATEMPCAAARQALATEPDGRHRDRTVRRHLRTCASCKAYGRGLRNDARSLRAVLPAPVGGIASGGAIFGGFAAKTVLTGGVITQVTAACAVSVCAVGGIALLYPHAAGHHRIHHSPAATISRPSGVSAGKGNAALLPSRRALPTSGQAGGRIRRSSAPAGSAVSVTRAPARATKLVSSASVVLSHQFHLPGSRGGGTPAGASPVGGAPPAGPTASPTAPVSPAPTRWGGLPGGYSSTGWGDPSGTSGGSAGTGTGSGSGAPGGWSGGTGSGSGHGWSGGSWTGGNTGGGGGTPSAGGSGTTAGAYPGRSGPSSAAQASGSSAPSSPGAPGGFW